jgi:hypothetical protein
LHLLLETKFILLHKGHQLKARQKLILQQDHDHKLSLEAATRAATEQEAYWKSFINTMEQIAWVLNAEDRIQIINPKNKNSEYKSSQLVNNPLFREYWMSVLHPEDVSPFFDSWAKAKLDKDKFEINVRLRTAEKNYLWHKVEANPVQIGESVIETWFGTSANIDTLIRAEISLEKQQQVALSLMEFCPLPQLELEGASAIHFLNKLDTYENINSDTYWHKHKNQQRLFLSHFKILSINKSARITFNIIGDQAATLLDVIPDLESNRACICTILVKLWLEGQINNQDYQYRSQYTGIRHTRVFMSQSNPDDLSSHLLFTLMDVTELEQLRIGLEESVDNFV